MAVEYGERSKQTKTMSKEITDQELQEEIAQDYCNCVLPSPDKKNNCFKCDRKIDQCLT